MMDILRLAEMASPLLIFIGAWLLIPTDTETSKDGMKFGNERIWK